MKGTLLCNTSFSLTHSPYNWVSCMHASCLTMDACWLYVYFEVIKVDIWNQGHTSMCLQTWWWSLDDKVLDFFPRGNVRSFFFYGTWINNQHNCKGILRFGKEDLATFIFWNHNLTFILAEQLSPCINMLVWTCNCSILDHFLLWWKVLVIQTFPSSTYTFGNEVNPRRRWRCLIKITLEDNGQKLCQHWRSLFFFTKTSDI